MALMVDSAVTVEARIRLDPKFAVALLDEAIAVFLNGEPDVARLLLRDLANRTMVYDRP
jgi:hypothetical protein